MKKYILIMLLILFYFTTLSFAYNNNEEIKKSKKDLFFNYDYYIVFNTKYQFINSNYTDDVNIDKSIITSKVDFVSQFKFTKNFGLSTSIQAIGSKSWTDTIYNTFIEDNQLYKESGEQNYSDIYFKSLYLTYKLPSFYMLPQYKHMIAFGTMPFQNGEWIKYKSSTPQEANGLVMMFDMTFDAVVYVADFTNYVNADLFQIRLGYGEHLKFENIYHQNKHNGDTFKGTTVSFINFDYKKNIHNIKLEAYHTDWKFNNINAGDATQFGVGYAYDKLSDDGYVIYSTLALSRSTTGSFMDYYILNSTPPESQQDKNIFIPNIPLNDNGFNKDDYAIGLAFDMGIRKEIWIEKFDVDWFFGTEFFISSDNWVATTLSGYAKCNLNTSLKGIATDVYTGIKFTDSKILTFSWIHENRSDTTSALNDINSFPFKNSNNLKDRDIFMVDFIWMFH